MSVTKPPFWRPSKQGQVGMEEMLAAVERVTMGPEKKNRVTSKKEKR